jgi:hypothetical protein
MRSPLSPDAMIAPNGSARDGSVRLACTVATMRTLPHARSVASTLRRYHPRLPFVILVADAPEAPASQASDGVHLLGVKALDIPGYRRLAFRFNERELRDLLVPSLLRHLLARVHGGRLLFLAPETMVLADLSPLIAHASNHPALVLDAEPAPDGCQADIPPQFALPGASPRIPRS